MGTTSVAPDWIVIIKFDSSFTRNGLHLRLPALHLEPDQGAHDEERADGNKPDKTAGLKMLKALSTATLVALALGSLSCHKASPCGEAGQGKGPAFEEAIVFLGEADGYPVFRIPSIVTTPVGTLLAFAEARPTLADPGSGKIDVVMKRSTDCGRTWSRLYVLAENGSGDAHNPVSLIAPDASGAPVIWLFFNKRPASPGGEFDLPTGQGDDSASIWLMISADEGLTWSSPRNITASVKNPQWAIASMGPGIAISTSWGGPGAPAGRMVVPGWYTLGGGSKEGGSFVILSDDRGTTWRTGAVTGLGTDESQVVELNDGSILLDSRQGIGTNRSHRRLFLSTDGGESWSSQRDGIEMTPVMTSILRYTARRDGASRDRLLHSGVSPDGRYGLRVWLSYDESQSWVQGKMIQEGFAQYSVLTVLADGSVGLLYETLETLTGAIAVSIRFARFNLAYLGDN